MTREEISKRIVAKKLILSTLKQFDKDITEEITDLEKQLAELEVEVYEPVYLYERVSDSMLISSINADEKYKDRHNAGEELKKLISEENQKQGWRVDWEDEDQMKYYIDNYNHKDTSINIGYWGYIQRVENELYFSEKSSKDQAFLDKIKPLWLKWKGIAE